MNIILDLDGTLIDSSERMFRLFQTLVPESTFSKQYYWDLKRNKITHEMILKLYFPHISFDRFNSLWMQKIEKEEYLLMDRNFDDTKDVLNKLSKKFDLYLLTARQSKQMLQKELTWLCLSKYFKQILVTQRTTSKKELLLTYAEENPGFLENVAYFVSDMGADILLGNCLGLTTVAITHGFMNRDKLYEYQPKFTYRGLTEWIQCIV